METATFRGRRGIAFVCALGGRAAGWRLVVDKPPLEACLVAGAEEHRLPADWIAALRDVPTRDETPEAAAFRPLLDSLMRKS